MSDPGGGTRLVEEAEAVSFSTDHPRHALGANRFPGWSRFDDAFSGLIRDWIVPGHLPPAAMLTRNDSVIAFGSCFAWEIRRRLERGGSEARNFWFSAARNHTFAVLDSLSWCVTGEETGQGFRYGRTTRGEIEEWTPDAERERYQVGLEEAGAFVFAFGTAEIWEDRETGGVFWRGVPRDVFDAGRHVFRLSTVEENEENILGIIELARSVNPTAPIVLMLTAGALKVTFRDVSGITADCVSKSVLRVAIDRVMSRRLAGVYYWPSFEMVRWANPHLVWPAISSGGKRGDKDARHTIPYLAAEIIDAFIAAFYVPDDAALLLARTPVERSPASLGGRFQAAFSSRRGPQVERGAVGTGTRPEGSANELRMRGGAKAIRPHARRHWHALGAKPFPPRAAFERDVPSLIRKWIMPGHTPPSGSLTGSAPVITLGSCFARELRTYLDRGGLESGNPWAPIELDNTFAILDFLSWCVTGEEAGPGIRYCASEEEAIREWAPGAERERYRLGLREAGAFVFALEQAEVRLSTVEENEENVLGMIELVRSVNATAPIVLMLSPVPLGATIREMSCMTADCVSKSVLRVALDRVRDRRLEGVYYWPAYEIVRWAGSHYPWRAYGIDDHDPRHVTRYLVAEIVDAFVEAFYVPEVADELRATRGSREPFPRSAAGSMYAASYAFRKHARLVRRSRGDSTS